MNFNKIKYSRGQQIVFVVLACFIVGCFVMDWLYDKFDSQTEKCFTPDSTIIAKIENFESELDSFEWQRQREFSPRRQMNLTQEKFEFDPNTIDSIDILRLGFQPFMAHNWLQYRRHGGKIYTHKKLRTIYGIDTLLIDSLKEFMIFYSVKPEIKDSSAIYKPKEFFTFELNSADTALLCKLPGIGKGRAAMIVARRTALGGFYSAEQLREIENIPDSIIDNIMPYITIELDSIKQININRSSVKRLHKHPYISYYQAKAIYDLRWDKKHNGQIENLEELLKLKEFNETEFERIKRYLKVTRWRN
ncbi:MAG: helix-hairpin-helix domain-containing protein [Paludibacteraceae bacterium]|nr:helix-hairpin-helix domain-containing protein [Paludibacteraceae bacterium]